MRMDTERSAARVLVVDDHQDTCRMTGRLLVGDGHDVRVAHGARAALAAAGEWRPHVLLCDLALPDGDGCDLLAVIRAAHPALRAVAVTGSGRPEDRLRCELAGFDGFLLKPVGVDDLVAAVRRACVRARELPAVGTPGSS